MSTTTNAATPASWRGVATDALRYWEPRRPLYNAVLATVVLAYFVVGLPVSKQAVSLNLVLTLFVLAVIANVLYCFAYLADVFVQLTSVRLAWRRLRWALLLVGSLFAATLTRFVSIGLFGSGVRP